MSGPVRKEPAPKAVQFGRHLEGEPLTNRRSPLPLPLTNQARVLSAQRSLGNQQVQRLIDEHGRLQTQYSEYNTISTPQGKAGNGELTNEANGPRGGPRSSSEIVDLNATIGGVYIAAARIDIADGMLRAYSRNIATRLAAIEAFSSFQRQLQEEFPVTSWLVTRFTSDLPESKNAPANLAQADISIRKAEYRAAVDFLAMAENEVDQLVKATSGYQESQEIATSRFISGLQGAKVAGGIAVGALTAGSGTAVVAVAGAGYTAVQEASEQAMKVHLGLMREIDWEGIVVDAIINLAIGKLLAGLNRFSRGKEFAQSFGKVAPWELRKIPEQEIKQFAIATGKHLLSKQTVKEMLHAKLAAFLQITLKTGYDSLRNRDKGQGFSGSIKQKFSGMLFDEKGDVDCQGIFYQALSDALGSATNRAAATPLSLSASKETPSEKGSDKRIASKSLATMSIRAKAVALAIGIQRGTPRPVGGGSADTSPMVLSSSFQEGYVKHVGAASKPNSTLEAKKVPSVNEPAPMLTNDPAQSLLVAKESASTPSGTLNKTPPISEAASKPTSDSVPPKLVGTEQTTKQVFAELKAELDSIPDAEGEVVGQKLSITSQEGTTNQSESPPQVFTRSKQMRSRSAKRAAEMQSERRSNGIDVLKDSALQDLVRKSKEKFGDGRTNLADLVADDPVGMEKLWEHWNAERKSGGIKAPSFEAYIKKLMSSRRGGYGEITHAFVVGAKEIFVKAPKGNVNEPGTDMLSYRKETDRIAYKDNKAYGDRNVDEVPALERNIVKNLNDDITQIEKAVREGIIKKENVPPEIEQKVLPRLKDAAREIDDYIKNNINQKQSISKQKAQLSRAKHQKAIDAILNNNHIDRVVTTEGGNPDISLTTKLRAKGFEKN